MSPLLYVKDEELNSDIVSLGFFEGQSLQLNVVESSVYIKSLAHVVTQRLPEIDVTTFGLVFTE